MPKKLLHMWDEWIYDRDNCTSVRTCTKDNCHYCCEEKESHDFGEWMYIQSDSCAQFRRCAVCNTIVEKEAEHIWGEWNYHTLNCCEEKRVCSHCGYTEFRIRHEERKIIPESGECVEELRCTRCGDIVVRQKEHKWTEQELPYVECLEHVIEHIGDKKESLIKLAQLGYENSVVDYQDYQYAALMFEIGNLTKRIEFLKDKKRLADSDDMGKFCADCKEILYLGKGSARHNNVKGFLSYAWANKEYADQIDRFLKKNDIYITRDIYDLDIGTKIQEFMDRIEQSKYIIVILSDSYLRSRNCMYEAVKAVNTLVKRQCILLPFVVNLDISNMELWNDYEKYWIDKIESEKGKQESLHEVIIYQTILDSLREFLSLVVEYKYEKLTCVGDIDEALIYRMIQKIKGIRKHDL